jgi:hypothetical protein
MIGVVRYPTECDFHSIPALCSQVSAAKVIRLITEIEGHVSDLDASIGSIYPMRSATRGIEDALAGVRQQTEVGKASEDLAANVNRIAKQMIETHMEKLQQIRSSSVNAVDALVRLISSNENWKNGVYSDGLLDVTCRLIFKLIALGKLCPTKRAVIDDFSILQRMTPEAPRELQELRIWLSSPNCGRMELLGKLNRTDYKLTRLVFKIFWKRISRAFRKRDFIFPEDKTAFILSALLFVDWYNARREAEVTERSKDHKLKAISQDYWVLRRESADMCGSAPG